MAKKKVQNQKTVPWWRANVDKIFFLILLGILFLFYPGQNIYMMTPIKDIVVKTTQDIKLPTPAPYPINITGIFPGSELTASGVVIVDVDSGVFLYKRNENESLAPASTTKILSALVALNHWQLDDTLEVKSLPTEGQMMGLIMGEKITLENLLYGMLIQSGNDAAWVIADNFSGGVNEFVRQMNAKAQEFHLKNSTFTNPVGYDDPMHKMTPIDLSRLAVLALTNKTIAKIVAIPQITISDISHTYFHSLKNVNQLLGKIPGVGGIKTGWTTEAGENLVTLVERKNHKVVIVLLNSKDRFGETSKLIDWVYTNYEWQIYGSELR